MLRYNRIAIFILALLTIPVSVSSLYAQYVPKYESAKKLRDTVLMNTDHFYFGAEMGLGFNLGPTSTISPGTRMETNVAPFSFREVSLFTPTKFFAGYAYKSHHFEGAIGLVRDNLNFSLVDSLGNHAVDYKRSQMYATMSVRYFYRFPIKIPRMKMMIGGEIGGGYHPPFLNSKPTVTFIDTNYTISTSVLTQPNFQLILGISGRMDIKIFKNVTLTLVATLIGSPLNGSSYQINYSYPGVGYASAQVRGSMLNINLNAGLKLDFFTHKSKKKTYEKYGIPDPFRDDQ